MVAEQEFKHESIQDCKSIIAYFQALCTCFENNALLLSCEGKRLVLRPQKLIEMQVEAKRKGGRSKLQIKMRWTEDDPEGELQVNYFENPMLGK